MGKREKQTKSKLDKLSELIGPIDINQKNENKTIDKKPSFKTSEVIVLLLITTIVGLVMGGAIIYKTNGYYLLNKVDDELQTFIKNYEYIVDNYSGTLDKEKIIDSAIEGILNNLDKNSTYLDEESAENFNTYLQGSYSGVGLQIINNDNGEIEVYGVLEGSSAEKSGLQKGDIITKYNNISVKDMTTEQLSEEITSSSGDVNITYNRDGIENTVTLSVSTVELKSVTYKAIEKSNKKIGYIYISIFAENTYKQFKKAVKDLEKQNIDSLIIDLRENSGGHLSSAENMISQFLDSSHVIYQIEKNNKTKKYYSKGSTTKDYKIVILVNNNSASASEVLTSALKEQYGATVIGETTYGKGSVQELQTLPSGNKYKITTKNWLTSKGNSVEGNGITPDIEISLDENYSNNPSDDTDNQLQKAIEEASK